MSTKTITVSAAHRQANGRGYPTFFLSEKLEVKLTGWEKEGQTVSAEKFSPEGQLDGRQSVQISKVESHVNGVDEITVSWE